MLKKMAILTGVLVIGSSPGWCREGFYIGLGIGPETAQFKQKSHITQPGNFDTREKTRYSGKGLFGSLYVGYGQCYLVGEHNEKFSLIGELNLDISSAIFKSSNKEFIHTNFNYASYAMRQGFGLSILPGFFVDPCTLFYARLGYTLRNIKITTTEITLPSGTKNCSGFRFGLGVKQYFCDQFAIRLEYSQALYQKINIFGFDPGGRVTKTTSIKPSANKFELGLAYYY